MPGVNWRSIGETIRERWAALREREDVQRIIKVLRYSLFAAVVAYLLYRLTHVGWGDVFDNLPASAWFYCFFAFRFLALPVSELAIYEIVWQTPLLRHVFVFIRKRVYNFAIMGYSGEAFLTLWARRRLALSDRQILVGVKDNNLLSAFASNSATVAIIAALWASGGLEAGFDAFPAARILFLIAFGTASTFAGLFLIFRRRILHLPRGVMPALLSVHGLRQTLIIALHASMYSAALPGAPLEAWLVFIAMQLVLSRIPFLPNQDVVYLTAALALSPIVGMPEAAVAGMLVAEAGLSQISNATLFAATSPLARSSNGR